MMWTWRDWLRWLRLWSEWSEQHWRFLWAVVTGEALVLLLLYLNPPLFLAALTGICCSILIGMVFASL